MSKRFHFAVGVNSIADSIKEYSVMLNSEPEIVIENEFALWRTDQLNFSIRKVAKDKLGFRHCGFEDSNAKNFTESKDLNNIVWEEFPFEKQLEEIKTLWPQDT